MLGISYPPQYLFPDCKSYVYQILLKLNQGLHNYAGKMYFKLLGNTDKLGCLGDRYTHSIFSIMLNYVYAKFGVYTSNGTETICKIYLGCQH